MTIPVPIETEYRGYRFRSRLEARWAVAFDHLGVAWKYETQGYRVGYEPRPYLPDFWLPVLGIWVEVKGDPFALDKTLMDDAVNLKSGLPGSDPFGEKSVLILGDIPPCDEPLGCMHWMVSRTTFASPEGFCVCWEARWSQVTLQGFPAAAFTEFRKSEPEARNPGILVTQIGRPTFRPPADVVTPQQCSYLLANRKMLDAFRAARMARFEHGEKPSAA